MQTFWNSFTAQQTLNIRNYLLNYIAARCSTLPPFVLSSLTQVLMRVTKLGWTLDVSHRNICDQVGVFVVCGYCGSCVVVLVVVAVVFVIVAAVCSAIPTEQTFPSLLGVNISAVRGGERGLPLGGWLSDAEYAGE